MNPDDSIQICGWQGRLVRLVPLDKEKHLKQALLWLNDPECTRLTLIGDKPITRLAEEEYFDKACRGDGNNANFAIETLAGEHIGFSGINNIDWRNSVGVTGTIIGPAAYRGKGFGKDSCEVRTRYAFEVLGLRMLLSNIMDGNERSLRMLKGQGYTEVGRIPRRYWKRGTYRDSILLVLERESWLKQQSKESK